MTGREDEKGRIVRLALAASHATVAVSHLLTPSGPSSGDHPLAASGEGTDEMRRALFALALAAVTGLALALAGPASAASGQVTHVRFHGGFAEAFWETSTATRVTDTEVNVSTSKQGSQLFVDQFTAHLDAHGNFAGATDTFPR